MPMSANGQALYAEDIGPTSSSGVAEPLRWRDGYMNWKGRKITGPDWLMFKTDDGATFAIDRSSIKSIGPGGLMVSAVAYFVEEDDFNPQNLISFALDCKHFTEVVTSVPPERVQLVEKQIKEIACP